MIVGQSTVCHSTICDKNQIIGHFKLNCSSVANLVVYSCMYVDWQDWPPRLSFVCSPIFWVSYISKLLLEKVLNKDKGFFDVSSSSFPLQFCLFANVEIVNLTQWSHYGDYQIHYWELELKVLCTISLLLVRACFRLEYCYFVPCAASKPSLEYEK